MKQFRLVQPDDAEVLRNGKWIRYDYASLVVGDIVRLVEGDVVPADCTVISLGMDHIDATTVVDEENTRNTIGMENLEITVDSRFITGEIKPRQISNQPNGTASAVTVANSTTLYYGSRVLEGACMALVTATGNRVVLAKLIREGRWPPQVDLSEEVEEINRMENEDVERLADAGIALTPMM